MHLVKQSTPPPGALEQPPRTMVAVALADLSYAIETLDEQAYNCASYDNLRAVANNWTAHQPLAFAEHRRLTDACTLLDEATGHLRRLLVGAEGQVGAQGLSSFWKKVSKTVLLSEVFQLNTPSKPAFDEQAELAKCRAAWEKSRGAGGVFADYWQGWLECAKGAQS